jgi:competence protein ComEC
VGGEKRAVIAAVVLGEDEGLSPELRDRFRASGLYHLLAVSGQNVAYVVAGMLGLAWLLGISRWIGELGALVAVGGYLMAVGWQPSVVRAGVAGGLASLAWLAGRQRDRWYFLLVGAAVLLAWNPYTFLEPGFQLSFGAVGSIFMLVPRIEAWLAGYPVPRALVTVLAVSIACGGVTAPILMLHFQAAPLFTVVSNAVAGPVVAPLLGLALLSTALEPVLPEAAAALAWLNGWLAAYLAGCSRRGMHSPLWRRSCFWPSSSRGSRLREAVEPPSSWRLSRSSWPAGGSGRRIHRRRPRASASSCSTSDKATESSSRRRRVRCSSTRALRRRISRRSCERLEFTGSPPWS